MATRVLMPWDPEDPVFWDESGRSIASRNLFVSMPALTIAFAVWMMWSVVVVHLPHVGFQFSTRELFWLTALPALCGATLRIFYPYLVPIFGGRRFTAISTALLLPPAVGIAIVVQDPSTGYLTLALLAVLCGLGGGNFASSMANIYAFFPKATQGTVLGLNAGLGNLGVPLVQFVVPLVITADLFGGLGGGPQFWTDGSESKQVWLQNAGFIWVPLIMVCALSAWFWMDDLPIARTSLADPIRILRSKHTWILCWLYLGTFGSYIGYSAGFPLLSRSEFPEVNTLAYTWLGPLVGALIRPFGGWLADRLGGARVTFWNFIAMVPGVAGVLYFLPHHGQGGNFYAFLAMFLVLFVTAGIGNGSTYCMIPEVFLTAHRRATAHHGVAAAAQAVHRANHDGAAVLGLSSAIGAYGGFFIPMSYGASIAMTGAAETALYVFIVFYLSCIGLTGWFYLRRGSAIRV